MTVYRRCWLGRKPQCWFRRALLDAAFLPRFYVVCRPIALWTHRQRSHRPTTALMLDEIGGTFLLRPGTKNPVGWSPQSSAEGNESWIVEEVLNIWGGACVSSSELDGLTTLDPGVPVVSSERDSLGPMLRLVA